MPPASSNNTFSIFTSEVQGLDETYIYSLPIIVANRGDSVTVSLHNTEVQQKKENEEEKKEEEQQKRRRRRSNRRRRRKQQKEDIHSQWMHSHIV